MFIVISKKLLIINSADIVEPEKEPGNSVSVFDLTNDFSDPVSIEWPPKIVPLSEESKPKQSGNPRVICGCVSPSEDLIALCDDQKNLVVFNNNFEAIYHFVVNRTCIKILFRSDQKAIFSCDKSGDIYEFCLSESKNQERLLLGHCSMLLDFILTSDDRYIIRYCFFNYSEFTFLTVFYFSCDRDEKIRVTNYPNTYNVQNYCLGHDEFVSAVQLLDCSTLVSGSGDGKVILWDFLTGKNLQSFDCEQKDISFTNGSVFKKENEQSSFPIKAIAIDSLNANYLAVSFYKQAVIYIFKVIRISTSASALELVQKLELDMEPVLVHFDKAHSNFLWVIGGFSARPVFLFELKQNEFKRAFDTNTVEFLNSTKQLEVAIKMEQQAHPLEGLFKHNYNNVEMYYQRKMLRIENESKK